MTDPGTRPVAPYRSRQAARDGFAPVLRAELTKLRTVRSWLLTLVLVAVLVVGFAAIGAAGNHSRRCSSAQGGTMTCTSQHPRVSVGPDGEPVVDSFSFVHRQLTGNGTLTARVTSLSESAAANSPAAGPGAPSPTPADPVQIPWAKAGLIIKDGTGQGSPYAAIVATPGHGVRMQHDFTHDTAGAGGAVTASSPRWLRLTRTGDHVTGYDSLDGRHWTAVGTVTLPTLPGRVEAGLVVTSPHEDPGGHRLQPSLATATFDSVRTDGGFTGSGWSTQVVQGDPDSYPSPLAGGSPWYRHTAATFTVSGSGDIAPQVAGGDLAGNGDTNSLQAGGAIGLLAVIVLATIVITSEYRRRLIATTLTATPRRGRMLAAKATVLGTVVFLTAAIATALAEAVVRPVLSHSGNYLFPVSAGAEARVVLGTGLLFALAAVLVLALGTMTRRSAGAVVTGIVLFVLPFVLAPKLPTSAATWLFRLTPTAGFAVQGTLPRFAQVANAYTLENGYYPLAPWAGLAVLAGWSVLALAAALWLLRRRDA